MIDPNATAFPVPKHWDERLGGWSHTPPDGRITIREYIAQHADQEAERWRGNVNLRIKRMHPDAKLPTYATEGAAGMDLYSLNAAALYIGNPQALRTGIAVAIPPGYAMFISPRSGLALHQAATVANAPGLIDSDYRGEIRVILLAHDQPVQISRHDRIAQAWIIPVPKIEWIEVDELPGTERGEGGFGHTGR